MHATKNSYAFNVYNDHNDYVGTFIGSMNLINHFCHSQMERFERGELVRCDGRILGAMKDKDSRGRGTICCDNGQSIKICHTYEDNIPVKKLILYRVDNYGNKYYCNYNNTVPDSTGCGRTYWEMLYNHLQSHGSKLLKNEFHKLMTNSGSIF